VQGAASVTRQLQLRPLLIGKRRGLSSGRFRFISENTAWGSGSRSPLIGAPINLVILRILFDDAILRILEMVQNPSKFTVFGKKLSRTLSSAYSCNIFEYAT